MMRPRFALLLILPSLLLSLTGHVSADGLVSPIPMNRDVLYDFSDQPLGPIGLGGAAVGQPETSWNDPQALVVSAGPGNQALQISKPEGGSALLRFFTPQAQDLNEGMVRIRFRMTPSAWDQYLILFCNPSSNCLPSSQSSVPGAILLSRLGNISAFGGNTASSGTIATYSAGETLDFVAAFNLDANVWSLELNGTVVLTDRTFNPDPSGGIRRVALGHAGTALAPAEGKPFLLDYFEALVPAPMTTLLDANFNDKTPGEPIGLGGARHGEPVTIDPNLGADIVSLDSDNQALQIEKTSATTDVTEVQWAFVDEISVSEGTLLVEFELTPRVGMSQHFRLDASNDGSPENLVRVSTSNTGVVNLWFPGAFVGLPIGEAVIDETLAVRIACNFDERHCSVALDGVWVVLGRSFSSATSTDIAVDRFISGFNLFGAANNRYEINQLHVLAERPPGIPVSMNFLAQPESIRCGQGQPLVLEVTAGDGGPATDMLGVLLTPDHPDITAGDIAGASTFTFEGIAEFPSVNVLRRGSNLRLTARVDDDFHPISVISEPFDILPGLPGFTLYEQAPGDVFAGQPFDPPVAVQIIDSCGETSVAGREISLVIVQGPDGATLTGNTGVTDAEGKIVFPDLVIEQPGLYQLAASFDGATLGGGSPLFTVSVAPPAAAAFQVQPSSVIATESISPAVEVYVDNIFGQPIADGTPVTLSLIDPGSALLAGNLASTVDGVATFDALEVSEPGSFRLRASVPDLPAGAEPLSEWFEVTAGPAALLAFESQPTSTTAGSTISPAVSIRVTDANGFNVDDGQLVSLSLASAPSGAELSGTLTRPTVSGIANFDDLGLTMAGEYRLLAEVPSGLTATSLTFNIAPASVHQLSYTVEPSDALVNQVLMPMVSVSAEDAFGNAVSDGLLISLTIVEGPASASLSGAAAAIVDGLAEFPSLSVNQPGSYRLQAQADGVPSDGQPTSQSFDILPGAPAAISFTQQPSTINAGASINPAVAVSVTDADGFAVADGTQISLSLASGPADGTLLGVVERTTVDGVASFPGLTIQVTGSYTIEAATDTDVQTISNVFQVNSASPHVLTYIDPPGNGVVNQVLAPPVTVEVRDQFDNLVTGSRTILVSAFEAPGDGSVSGVFADTVDGVATFDSLRFNTPGTWRLRASANGVPFGNRPISEPFDIVAGPPASLEIEQQPSTTVINEFITPPVSVRVLDADGFDVADGISVHISLATGPDGAVLDGTLSQNTSNGLAVFSDLSLDRPGEYVLQANVDDVITTASLPFNVINTNPASAAFLSEPSTTVVGEVMMPPVAVEVLDGENGPVADGTAVVLVLVEPGEASIGGGVAATSDGVAVFDALVVSRPGSYQLRAEVSGLEPAAQPISEAFDILPGPAASMTIEQQPSTTYAGQVISPPITIRLLDEFGTPVSDGQVISLTDIAGPAGATVTGTLNRATVDGMAVFDDLVIEQPDSEYRLFFEHGHLTVESDDFAIVADRLFRDRFEAQE
ncbi:MAG: MSCRAMM family protein [Wenzhouxiangella sp.]